MSNKAWRGGFVLLLAFLLLPLATRAQQSLGSINGTVTDSSGAVAPKVTVKVRNEGTNLQVTTETQSNGSFNVVDLPIGTYSVTFTRTGFKTEVHNEVLVQANRTATVDAVLQPGEVSTQVTVSATPLLNRTDTTNGYVLSSSVIQSTPLGTGSFTQLAVLAPGVNADLLSGSGTNAGLGNQNIWANGQRDTSNGFAFNGVNATNVFNGKSSSSVSTNRFVLNTGETFLQGGAIQTGTSVYDAIGQGLPTPPPETIQEMHVNTSMYDASQGANSGAHIELITKSGTNDYHGQVYEYHQTTGWNANQFFFNAAGVPRPPLHRNTFGGLFGGPILRNKMFFFASYQGQRVSDNFASSQQVPLPVNLTSDRSAAGLAAAANTDFGTSLTASDINPISLAIMQATLPNGQLIVPNPQITNPSQEASLHFATVEQGAASRFIADQVNGNIDYNFGSKDRISEKYYFQRSPTTNAFPPSPEVPSTLGFPSRLKAGSQVLSLDNTTMVTPNMTWEQRFGFIREIAFASTGQALTPQGVGINLFGNRNFPGITIGNMDSNFNSLGIGPVSNFDNAGVFQNQFEWATNLSYFHGRHNVSFGFSWDRNQLNVINQNNQVSRLEFRDFPSFLEGNLRFGEERTALFNGSSNRYYRTNQAGAYAEDNFRLKPALTIDVGLRWDWDGPLTEKNGFLTNFFPQDYSYNLSTDTISNIGLVVAGNNKAFGTKGVSASTLTGRQWGFGPRIGLVWSPSFVKNFVVRTGFGMYYDRGEFFTEFSPSAGFGFNGPFGVTLEPPFIVPCVPFAQSTPVANCGTGANSPTFANPFGTSPPPPPPTNLSQVAALAPCQGLNSTGTCTNAQANGITTSGLIQGTTPFLFGGYDPRNKLPYSENWTLDLQWQPTNTLLLDLAYVGNHGVHETLPIPFNQAQIATPTNPVNGQSFSYGFQATDASGGPGTLLTEPFNTSTGGNTDLRVPFIGYSPNSVFYEAEGISHYNALQFGVNKRFSHGLLVTGSYTWSHSLDEGSGLQLFYNGNNPLNPKSAYGSSGFDRTHVFTVSYLYQFPKVARFTGVANTLLNGWGISGVTVVESGQPYSVYDFSGDVGSQFWGAGNDFITNPLLTIVNGSVSSVQLQGTTGVNAGNPVINAAAFGVTIIPPGTGGVPPCGPTTDNSSPTAACDFSETVYGATGRNVFRGPFQTRFDFAISKDFKLSERFSLKYDAQFFNIFNHASFDTPMNNFTLDSCFGPNLATSPANGCLWDGATRPVAGGPPVASGLAPAGLGFIGDTLGSPRFIQMALHLQF